MSSSIRCRFVLAVLATLFAMLLNAEAATAATITVTNELDIGNGSLRAAINAANSTTAADVIQFNIPGSGPFVINVASPLPTITQPLTIDGYTQPGASPNTLDDGDDAVILIRIDGATAGSTTSGLSLCNAATIRGLSITNFQQHGIAIGSDNQGSGCGGVPNGSLITGNFIGLATNGSTLAGNRFCGVLLFGAQATIGGATPALRNVISGNGSVGGSTTSSHGIQFNDAGSSGTVIQGNYIGTDATGRLDRGNRGEGVHAGISSTGAIVGGARPNRIAFNFTGIGVIGSASGDNLGGNEIFGNDGSGVGGGGIDLYAGNPADGPTANDLDDTDTGGNSLQNFPAGISVSRIPTGVHVNAVLDRPAGAVAKTYGIGVYANSACDPSGFGEGERFLGSIAFISANGSAQTINADLAVTDALPIGTVITLTATDNGTGDTSEFSACAPLDNTTPLVVTSTADTDGTTCGATCTLRQAINAANASPGGDTIRFNVPGAGGALILPATPLPTITEALVIDGYSQPGAVTNSSATISNATLKVQIDGQQISLPTTVNGLGVCASDVTIRGLSIVRFNRQGIAFGNTSIAGGCTAPAGPFHGAAALGNFVGLVPGGGTAGNSFSGILFVATDGMVGSSAPADRNVVSNNGAVGVNISTGSAVTVDGNLIGTDPSGTIDRGNINSGIAVQNSDNTPVRIGEAAPNLLRGNHEGVRVASTASNATFFANDFIGNDTVGIDLCATSTCPDGVTPNDADDADAGGNNLQNFPVLTSAKQIGSTLRLTGTLDVPVGFPSSPQRYALYTSASCDASGNGEGELFLGVVSRTTTTSTESFVIDFDATAPIGSAITSTVTANGSTSEFSNCVSLVDGDPVFKDSFE